MSIFKFSILSLALAIGLIAGSAKASDEFEALISPFSDLSGYPDSDIYLTGPRRHPLDTATQILTMDTDAFPGTFSVDIGRDDTGQMTTLLVHNEKGEITTYTLDQLRQFQSVKQVKGHDAVFLRVETDFEPVHGGHATLRFLQNGLWGTYKNFRMMIDVQGKEIVLRSEPTSKDPDSDRNPFTGVFNHLFMRKNTVFGQVAGIDEIVPSLR